MVHLVIEHTVVTLFVDVPFSSKFRNMANSVVIGYESSVSSAPLKLSLPRSITLIDLVGASCSCDKIFSVSCDGYL